MRGDSFELLACFGDSSPQTVLLQALPVKSSFMSTDRATGAGVIRQVPTNESSTPLTVRLDVQDIQRPPAGNGYLAGTFPDGITKVEGKPSPADIRVHFRPAAGQPGDGLLVASTTSDASGSWRIDGLDPTMKYDVVCRRPGYNDLVLSDVSPVATVTPPPAALAVSGNPTVVLRAGSGELVFSGGKPPYTFVYVGLPPADLGWVVTHGVQATTLKLRGSYTGNTPGVHPLSVQATDAAGATVTWEGQVSVQVGDAQWPTVAALIRISDEGVVDHGAYSTAPVTLTGITPQAGGKFGRHLKFAGTNAVPHIAASTLPGPVLSRQEDFTVELFVRLDTSSTATQTALSRGVGAQSMLNYWLNVGPTGFSFTQSTNGSGGSTETISATSALTVGQWHHLAVTNQGGLYRLFLNGVKVAERQFTTAPFQGDPTHPLRLGSLDYGPSYNYWLQGSVEEVRVSKGVARYTADFTPPTQPFLTY